MSRRKTKKTDTRWLAKNASGGALKFRDQYIDESIARQERQNARRVKPEKVDSAFLHDCNALAAQWAAKKK